VSEPGQASHIRPQLIECALVPYDAEYMIDLHQNVREDDCQRQMLREDNFAEAEVVVIRLGTEEEEIGQPLLDDEPLKVPHVGVADARRAALDHMESSYFSWLALLMDLE
jgi:hypothetical protein